MQVCRIISIIRMELRTVKDGQIAPAVDFIQLTEFGVGVSEVRGLVTSVGGGIIVGYGNELALVVAVGGGETGGGAGQGPGPLAGFETTRIGVSVIGSFAIGIAFVVEPAPGGVVAPGGGRGGICFGGAESVREVERGSILPGAKRRHAVLLVVLVEAAS